MAVPVGLELELSKMSPADRAEFEREMGLVATDRDHLIRTLLRLSGQMIFFTAGEKEVRTWLLRHGRHGPGGGRRHPLRSWPAASSAPKS